MVRYTRPSGDATRTRLLQEFYRRHEYPPTYQELADALGLKINAIRHNVDVLIATGMLSRARGKSRGIRLTQKALDELTAQEPSHTGAEVAS